MQKLLCVDWAGGRAENEVRSKQLTASKARVRPATNKLTSCAGHLWWLVSLEDGAEGWLLGDMEGVLQGDCLPVLIVL